jgi:hypothetical protein
MTDDLMALADAVREPMTPARRDPGSQVPALPAVAVTGGPVSFPGGREEPVVAADSEGRTGGDQSAPGAVPFTLPPTPPAWRRS